MTEQTDRRAKHIFNGDEQDRRNAIERVQDAARQDVDAMVKAVNIDFSAHDAAEAWVKEWQDLGDWDEEEQIDWVDNVDEAIQVYERVLLEELADRDLNHCGQKNLIPVPVEHHSIPCQHNEAIGKANARFGFLIVDGDWIHHTQKMSAASWYVNMRMENYPETTVRLFALCGLNRPAHLVSTRTSEWLRYAP